MATVPAGTKFLGLDASIHTPELSGRTINNKTQHYTLEDIAESVVGGLPYKEFTARVFQDNISNPITLTVIKNDFESTPTVDNDFGSPYDFLVTLADEFVFEKTVVTSNPERNNIIISYPSNDDSTVACNCFDFAGNQAAPISFTFTIKVYN